jgi:segregation and condensation protein A
MIHRVQLETFDGPIELLIYLVRQQELSISEIPIALVTDQYLNYIQSRASINIENAAEFLLMAVVLIRMKMRSLLPRPEGENLETGSLVSMDEIMAEFRRYQQAAQVLSGLETQRRNLFPRSGASRAELDTSGDVMLLTNAFRRIIAQLEPKADWVVERVQLHIAECLIALRALLAEHRVIDFDEYLRTLPDLARVIITFLAVLELTRLGEIRVSQDEVTGGILLFRRAAPPAQSDPEPGEGS